MSDKKFKTKCKTCGKERLVAKSTLCGINNGNSDGDCRRCSKMGHRYNAVGDHVDVPGIYSSAFYKAWGHMKERCDNENNCNYIRYGKRGITYDLRWVTFDMFFKDMYHTYKKGLTIDRINNNGDYTKANCKWSTPKQQARNRSNNRRFTINGIEKILIEWTELYGISYDVVSQRINGRNWPIEKALTTPVIIKRNKELNL